MASLPSGSVLGRCRRGHGIHMVNSDQQRLKYKQKPLILLIMLNSYYFLFSVASMFFFPVFFSYVDYYLLILSILFPSWYQFLLSCNKHTDQYSCQSWGKRDAIFTAKFKDRVVEKLYFTETKYVTDIFFWTAESHEIVLWLGVAEEFCSN